MSDIDLRLHYTERANLSRGQTGLIRLLNSSCMARNGANVRNMQERNPRYEKFSADVDGKHISWCKTEPYLTGDEELIARIRIELGSEDRYLVTPTGPYIQREVSRAAPVYLAILALFGESADFTNPPNLNRLWLEPGMLGIDGELRDDLVF